MAALIGTSHCFCSGLAVKPDGVETVWHDDQLMWRQQQSDWELGPLLLQPAPLSSETNCCCQVNKKTCPHQSCSQKASPSSWFWLLVYKTPNGLAVLCTSEKKCVWWEATRLPHFSADIWLDAHSPLTFLWVRKRCFFPHAGFCVSTPHLTHHFT